MTPGSDKATHVAPKSTDELPELSFEELQLVSGGGEPDISTPDMGFGGGGGGGGGGS